MQNWYLQYNTEKVILKYSLLLKNLGQTDHFMVTKLQNNVRIIYLAISPNLENDLPKNMSNK